MRLKKGQGKTTKQCEVCGKSFESLICSKRRFCSAKCGYEGRRLYKNQQEYKCETCGKIVTRCQSQVKGKVFCSIKCRGISQKNKTVFAKPRDPSKRQLLTCKQCGKQFERFTCMVVPNRDAFCSQSCSSKYTNKYKRGSKSKLEKWLAPKLKEFNLPVLLNNRKILNGYELDIYFPTKNLAFEIDGPWHRFPFHGESHLLQIQTNDKIKNNMCQQLGITLIRIPNENTFTEAIGIDVFEQISNHLRNRI